MALPKSTDKQRAILDATAAVIAEVGTDAPTKRIAKLAGIAEGTLFTYFASKDILLNAVYLDIKTEMFEQFVSTLPKDADAKERIRIFWNSYVLWGAERPERYRAMMKLGVCERITAETRAEGSKMFAALHDMLSELSDISTGCCKEQTFMGAVLGSLADTAIGFMLKEPEKKQLYADLGYKAFQGFLDSL